MEPWEERYLYNKVRGKGSVHEEESARSSMSCFDSMDDAIIGTESRVKEKAQMSKCVDRLPELVKYAINTF